MAKDLRPGKVLVDWSQNSAAKTTVSVYSLAGAARADGVDAGHVGRGRRPARHLQDLVFTSDDVLARVEEHGDLFADLLGKGVG